MIRVIAHALRGEEFESSRSTCARCDLIIVLQMCLGHGLMPGPRTLLNKMHLVCDSAQPSRQG